MSFDRLRPCNYVYDKMLLESVVTRKCLHLYSMCLLNSSDPHLPGRVVFRPLMTVISRV